jgi:nitrite reductase (NADH) small subunit
MSDPAGTITAGVHAARGDGPGQSTRDSRATTQILPAPRCRAVGGPGRGGSRHRQPKGSYMTVGSSLSIRWTAVCQYSRLAPDRGVAALIGGAQVAIFRTSDGEVYAIGHQDPVSGAHVMSRGIVATRDGAPTISSPSLRHLYDLHTGECLDLPGIKIPVYPVRCRDGVVEVGIVTTFRSDRVS